MAIAEGLVTTAPAGSSANNTQQTIALGRANEQIITPLHGTYYTATLAGKVFVLATAAAGTTIPVQATNLVGTFTLLNPITSSINVELISYSMGITNATTVVGDISLYYQAGIGNANAALASTTSLTARSTILGNGASPQSAGYSAATFTNTVGTNMFRAFNLNTYGAVTSTNAGPIRTEFNGSIIIPPGTAITVAGTAAQTQATTQTLVFAEWPI